MKKEDRAIRKYNNKDILLQISRLILMFMFIYEFQLKEFPTFLSSRKIAFVIFFTIFLVKLCQKKYVINRQYISNIKPITIIMILISIYVLVINIFLPAVEGRSILSQMVYLIIYSLAAPVIFPCVYTSMEQLAQNVIWSNIIQSFIIYAQFCFVPIKELMHKYVVNSGNVSYLRADRAKGLGAEGALLSVLLFLGILMACYFIIFKREKKYFYPAVFMFIAGIPVGRTGVCLSAVILAITFIIYIITEKNKQVIICACFMILETIAIMGFMRLNAGKEYFDWVVQRQLSIIVKGYKDDSIVQFINTPAIVWNDPQPTKPDETVAPTKEQSSDAVSDSNASSEYITKESISQAASEPISESVGETISEPVSKASMEASKESESDASKPQNDQNLIAFWNKLMSRMIIGTGIRNGTSFNGMYFRHDSGYAQTYFGLGIIGSIIFYMSWYLTALKVLLKQRRQRYAWVMGILLAVLPVLEVKEPFLSYYIIMFLFFCFAHYGFRDDAEHEAMKGV